jgi:hypothetical protein
MKYEYLTMTATKVSRSWTNKQKIQFHYFNPNGLYAQKQALNNTIWALVEEGKAKTGAVIAYGSGNTFYPDILLALYKKSRVSDSDYYSLISGYKFDIESAEKFIKEVA